MQNDRNNRNNNRNRNNSADLFLAQCLLVTIVYMCVRVGVCNIFKRSQTSI